jgi:hypothetical protein
MRMIRVLKVLVIAVVACVVFGLVVEHLWNWLMPGIFGLPAIGYWKAIGLLLLSKILFGGIHRHGGRGRGRRDWKERMEKKFAGMSPEERERFRAGMRGRWGCRPRGGEEGFGKPVV